MVRSDGDQERCRSIVPPAWRTALRLGLLLVGSLLSAPLALRAAPAGEAPAPAAALQQPPVVELTDLSQLQARFNADIGKPRLLLLLSPT